MPNHSQLLDANDLHYAKARLFTGSPTEITPDFAGQILMDGLGRMFVAASKSVGDLVQVAGSVNVGGGSIGSTAFGEGRPLFTPEIEGQQYFDVDNFETYYAYHINSPSGWIRNKILGKIYLSPRNDLIIPNSIPDSEIGLRIYYVDPYLTPPATLGNTSYELSDPIKEFLPGELNIYFETERNGTSNIDRIDLTNLFNLYGNGSYVLSFTTANEIPVSRYSGIYNIGDGFIDTSVSAMLSFTDPSSTQMRANPLETGFLNFALEESKTLHLGLIISPL